MIFRHFLTDNNESNVFIIGCGRTKDAIFIDAGDLNAEISAFIDQQRLHPTKAFITHDHYDHTGGLPQMVSRYGAEVLAAHTPCGGCPATPLKHGDTVQVGDLTGTVLATPGHTPSSLCLALAGMVFTGDALFAGSVGGTASAAAKNQQLEAIRTHLFALPDETEVHTGHGPSSTIGIERRYNPFFV